MDTPQFKHDCAGGCEFLGRYESPMFSHYMDYDGSDRCRNYDLYVHWKSNGKIQTLLARYGNKGEEYTSGLFGLNYLALQEAARRVMAKYVRKGN